MAEDKAQSQAPWQPPEPGLEGRMLGLALVWGLLDPADLREAHAEAATDDSAGLLAWLADRGLLTPDQLEEMEAEARHVAMAADAAPTARYRIPDTESVLLPDAGGPPSGAFRLPGRPSGATAPDVLVSSSLPEWGPYERLRLIGEGGMARIFKAFDPRLRRQVAIKVLRRDEPELLQRFMNEAQAQALVEHEHVCRIFETGDIGGQAYIAMQLIQGQTFKAAITTASLREKAELMAQACEGVHAAHRRGLIHRDLKPANLMVERDEDGKGKAYVLDFGLARSALAGKGLTATGFVMGTVVYMSPEQARGEVDTMDRRADVYSLGASFYELLTGCPPYGSAEGLDALRKIIYEEPPAPRKRDGRIPEDLETITLKCLEKDPARRYDSARALGDDLQRWLDGDPIMARPLSRRERLVRFASRNKLVVGIAAGALVAVLLAGGVALTSRIQSAARARWAQHFGQEAERLESLMRYGKLLPPHDIRRERRAVEERLRAMEREIAGAGRVAQGPGAYAIGRTWLALGDPAKAREHLQRAREKGFEGPEVVYALGRAFGLLYQRELIEAQLIPEPDARKARLKELETGLKREALALLRSGRGSELEPAEYQEGHLALVDGRHQDAVRLARSAFARAPWFFEAKRLEVEGLLAAARAEVEPSQAAGKLRAAGEQLAIARSIAPSDPGLLDLESLRCHDLLGRIVREALEPSNIVQAQAQVCQAWEVVEPGNPEPPIRLAIALSEMARFTERRPGPTGDWMAQAEAQLENAKRLDPNKAELYIAEGSILRIKARTEESTGHDPVPMLQQAVAAARNARRLAPSSINANLTLLRTYVHLLETLSARGADCSQVYPEARTTAEDLMRRYPDVATYPGLFGAIQVEMASSEVQQGRDPRAYIRDAIPRLELARKLNPQNPAHAYSLANAYLVLAERNGKEGVDPRKDLRLALGLYEALIRQTPGNPYYLVGGAMALELESRWLIARMETPTTQIRAARDYLGRAEASLPATG
ncbi:MAG: serine/threonine protein kinase [Holophagaceae bacterium]|nr:serine/threonine protein kinase [Holophagaceae bacterium]